MKPRLFYLLARVTLVLCVAFGAAWVQSYADPMMRASEWTENGSVGLVYFLRQIVSDRGQIILAVQSLQIPLLIDGPQPSTQHATEVTWYHEGDLAMPITKSLDAKAWGKFGFYFLREYDSGGREAARWIAFPHWAIVLITAIPPIAWIIHLIRFKRRLMEGRCQVCGYDLRATPERCPECGAIQTAAKGAAA